MSISLFSCYSCGVNDDEHNNEPTEAALVVPTTNTTRTATVTKNKNNHTASSSSSSVLRNSNSHGTFATEESTGSSDSSSSSNRENHHRKTATAAKNSSSNNNNNTMRRASISRRNDHMASPTMRARSQERHQKSNNTSSSMMQEDLYAKEDEQDSVQRFQETSNSSSSKSSRIHRRSVSDPFDAQQGEVDLPSSPRPEHANGRERTTSSSSSSFATSAAAYYWTLPRYPVAETRDKNCWSEPDVSIFSVRGSNYLVDKKKQVSKQYIMASRGCDLFLSESTNVDLNAIGDHILGGRLRSLPTLLVNFRFPWGVLILYYEVPEKLRPYMLQEESATTTTNGNGDNDDKNKLTRQELVLAKWLQGDEDYKNERLKLISYVAEGPWVVRNMVTGRPALIGKKLPVTYSLDKGGKCNTSSSSSRHHHHHAVIERQPLLQCTLDIGSSSATAKRIVSVCRRYMASLTVDIGFVIQAEEEHELPEQMMGSTRVHGVDPLKAPQL